MQYHISVIESLSTAATGNQCGRLLLTYIHILFDKTENIMYDRYRLKERRQNMKAFSIALALVLAVTVCGCADNADITEEVYGDEVGILDVGTAGVRIHAPLADIKAYLNTDSEAEKEQILAELMANSENTVIDKEPITGVYQVGEVGTTVAEDINGE